MAHVQPYCYAFRSRETQERYEINSSLAPKPGRAVRGSDTGRPIMALLDLLGRRGALRVLWELRDGAAVRFRPLQTAAELSPSVLNTRLAELREVNIVELTGDGYRLTSLGRDLTGQLSHLAQWSEEWSKSLYSRSQ